MPWVRVDDAMPDHPKVVGLSDAALAGWLRCLCWCARNLTDGVLPAPAWRSLVKPGGRSELLAAGLMVAEGDAVRMHDYLRYQPDRESVLRERSGLAAARSEAGRKGGIASGQTRAARKQNGSKPEATVEQTLSKTEAPILYGRRTPVQPSVQDDDVRPSRPSSSSLPSIHGLSSRDWGRQQKAFAYVGQRLKVPHKLHAESCAALGGPEPDLRLMAWYDDLDADLVQSGEPLPDVFPWLRERRTAWLKGLTPAAVPVAARNLTAVHVDTGDYHTAREAARARGRA